MPSCKPERRKKKDVILLDMYNTLITGGSFSGNEIAKRECIDPKTVSRYG